MESSDERYCSPLILLKGGQPPGAKSSRLRMFESLALNREAGSSPLPGTSESSDLWSNPKMTLPSANLRSQQRPSVVRLTGADKIR